MQPVKRVALGALLVAAGVAVTVIVRTLSYAPHMPPRADLATIPAAPPIAADVAAGHLGEAIRIRTISHQDPADDDLAAWDALHAWLEATYPAAHAAMHRELVAGRTLLYTWPGSDLRLPPVILMAHQDVVPVEAGSEGRWRHPPFSGELADGAVWGRGAVDDKGSLVALFEAIDLLARRGFKPVRTLLVLSGHNEEVQGGGAKAVALLLASRHVRAEFVLDEGLVVTSSHPVTHAPVALIGIAEKGYASLAVTAHASGGHSSMPPDETAVTTLAEAVLAILRHPGPEHVAGPTAAMLAALAPDAPLGLRVALANDWLLGSAVLRTIRATPAGAAMIRTTMAPTMLSGSPKENVLPQLATATINYRIEPGDSSAAVLERAQAAVGKRPVTLAWLSPPIEPSVVSSTESRGWRLLAALAADAARGPVTPALVLGGTDSRSLQPVAADVYRFEPVTLDPADYDMVHGTNEHLTVANLSQAIRFYARLITAATG